MDVRTLGNCRRLSLATGLLVALFAGGGVFSAHAQDVAIFRSSAAGERLASVRSGHFERRTLTYAPDFVVDEGHRHQTILGFGASFLEAGSITLQTLPVPAQEDVLRMLFDPHSGAGFSAMKTVIGGTDFQSAGPFYTYDEATNDYELKHFTIDRDLARYGLIPYIRRARRYGQFILQAPMDFPPDWMLKNAKTDKDVKPELYSVLTDYYLKYLRAYSNAGIDIDYLSPFNEPGMYTQISVPEIASLVRDDLGPALARSSLRTRLQLSESPFRGVALAADPSLLGDPSVRRYVSSISYHGYDYLLKDPYAAEPITASNLRTISPYKDPTYKGVEFDAVRFLHEAFPHLALWQSEVCYISAARWVKVPVYGFADGDFWGRQIISDLRAGAAAWTYWNMILDETGGPWLVDPAHGNPPHNAQHPVVIINKVTGRVTYTGLFYYLAHFSKWVRPGAVRIDFAGRKVGIEGVAFEAKGRITVELINSATAATPLTLQWNERTLSLDLPPQSISTVMWKGARR